MNSLFIKLYEFPLFCNCWKKYYQTIVVQMSVNWDHNDFPWRHSWLLYFTIFNGTVTVSPRLLEKFFRPLFGLDEVVEFEVPLMCPIKAIGQEQTLLWNSGFLSFSISTGGEVENYDLFCKLIQGKENIAEK